MQDYRQPTYSQPDQSFYTLDYTFSDSKYSCISWMYPLHIIFAYLVGLTGLLALISRVVPKMTPYHATFGRFYIICMLWCMASSLLIYNTGLPFPIIVSFIYLLVTITIGWNVIKLHSSRITSLVTEKVNEKLNTLLFRGSHSIQIDINKISQEEKNSIQLSSTFFQRMFSLRMLHGILMTFSWSQIVGRTFVTNPFKSFHGCWTYPAYKSLEMNDIQAVDGVSTPGFAMKDGIFITMITVPTLLIILIVALTTTYCYTRSEEKSKGG